MSRLSWWSWLLCGAALLAGLLGWEPGVFLAAGLAALHAVMLGAIFGRSASVAIQLRGLFTAVALLGAVLHLPALHWIQLAGTAVRLFLGYCVGGRVLLLLPWNRSRPLSLDFLTTVFLPRRLSESASASFDGPAAGVQRGRSARSASPS